MKALRVSCSVVATVVLLLFPPSTDSATPRTLTAKVERVSDGDTLTAIANSGTKLRMRLLGIEGPEIPHGDKPAHAFGEEARDYLDHLIGGKTVRLDA